MNILKKVKKSRIFKKEGYFFFYHRIKQICFSNNKLSYLNTNFLTFIKKKKKTMYNIHYIQEGNTKTRINNNMGKKCIASRDNKTLKTILAFSKMAASRPILISTLHVSCAKDHHRQFHSSSIIIIIIIIIIKTIFKIK